MKACQECKHFQAGTIRDHCTGPHAKVSVITGHRFEELPGARYWDPVPGNGWNPGTDAEPCGEIGRHWEEKPPLAKSVVLWNWVIPLAALVIYLLAFLGVR